MKIKTLVAFALFIAVFLVTSIFLINFLKAPAFVYLYFIFAFLWLIAISVSLKKAYPEEIILSFLIIIAVFIALSLTFFGSNVKSYYDKNKEIIDSNLLLNSQIENLTKTNDYYITYVDFLNGEILKTQQATSNLQSQLENLIAQQNLANQANQAQNQTQNTTQNNTPIIINKGDGGEKDD
jgi:hypothetical protein